MKILVCDDAPGRGEKTQKAIAAGTDHETRLLAGDELTREIRGLFGRAASTLNPNSGSAGTPSDFESDEYDIAILDNNLSELDIQSARHTAESIAGYVRAFWKIPYIVSLNKNPHVDFDLRYLVGDYQTHADLALNDKHLSIPALWTGISVNEEFRPWYWPALEDVVGRRRRQIAFVKEHLDDSIPECAEPSQVGCRPAVATCGRRAVTRSAIGAPSHVPEVFCGVLPVLANSKGTRATGGVHDVEGRPAVRHRVPRRSWRAGPLDSPQPSRTARRARRSSASPDAHAIPSRSARTPAARMERRHRRNQTALRTFGPTLSGPPERRTIRRRRVGQVSMFLVDGPQVESGIEQEVCCESPAMGVMRFSARICRDSRSTGRTKMGHRSSRQEIEGAWARRHVAIVGSWSYTPISRFAK